VRAGLRGRNLDKLGTQKKRGSVPGGAKGTVPTTGPEMNKAVRDKLTVIKNERDPKRKKNGKKNRPVCRLGSREIWQGQTSHVSAVVKVPVTPINPRSL